MINFSDLHSEQSKGPTGFILLATLFRFLDQIKALDSE